MQEREDDVKTMNAMVQYSRTVAIRDAQLREKKLIARKKILEEKREGILMEIARIKQVSDPLLETSVDIILSKTAAPTALVPTMLSDPNIVKARLRRCNGHVRDELLPMHFFCTATPHPYIHQPPHSPIHPLSQFRTPLASLSTNQPTDGRTQFPIHSTNLAMH